MFWVASIALLGATVYLPVALKAEAFRNAFIASSTAIGSIFLIGGAGSFPKLLPSTTDMSYSLTIYNASPTPATLKVMLAIALLGMPLVIGYTIFIYRIFKGKTVIGKDGY